MAPELGPLHHVLNEIGIVEEFGVECHRGRVVDAHLQLGTWQRTVP